jgi:two-component system sensor histidine kinase DevS
MSTTSGYSAEEIRALLEASVSLTSDLSLDSVLQKVADVAREQIGARYAALSVLNSDGEIEKFIASGITAEERERIGHIPVGRGLLGVLLHEGVSLRMDDMGKDPHSVGFPPNHPPMKSLLGVPVISHGRIVGNLYLTDKQAAPGFNERDEDLLGLLSTQASVAIINAELYEAERRRADEWQALFDLSREVTVSADLKELLDSVVQRATKLLSADLGLLMLLSPDGGSLRIAAQVGLRTAKPRGPLAIADHDLLQLVIETGRSVVVADRRHDKRLDGRPMALLDAEGLVSAIEVPLKGKDNVLGAIVVGNRAKTGFSDQQAELVETFGNLTAVAIETRQLYEKVESLARLEERERIGMDLHDGVIQSIYAVGLHLEDLSERLPGGAEELKPDIEKAMDDLNKVIKDIRSYIFDLRPQLSEIKDLPAALVQLVEHFRVNTLVTIVLDISDPFESGGGEAEAMALFHIAQEALNNVSKHANATSVTVRLSSSPKYVSLEVEDNGIGFEAPAEGISGARHGVRNMRDRARSVAAKLSFESSPGRGTMVRVNLPVRRKEGSSG